MNGTSFVGLVQNAALLLAMAFLFDLAASRWRIGQTPFWQAMVGLALGAIGVTVMLTQWTFGPGIVFDTRSVLLSIAGLFFGTVSTAVAMAMTAALRFYQGGTGVWTGVAVILTSGMIGIAWRHFRHRPLSDISGRELYFFGIVIHLAMLGLMLALPWATALRVISNIALPVILIYPLGTALLGMLMVNRLKHNRSEEACQESEQKYYDLYDNAPDMYYTVDSTTGVIMECNETFSRNTGYSREELIGRPIFELYDSGSADESKKSLQQFPLTGEVHDDERRVKCKDGRIINVSLNVSAIRDKDGNITQSRAIWRDITKRKEQEAIIHALSITDQMTGLYNRRGFMTLAEQQLRVAERTKNGLFLVYADLDGLKQINDRLGHASGDEAIVEAANVLHEVFRKMDIIARIGGDEFAVLAPEASLEYADMIKNRLQDRFHAHNLSAGRDYNLSLSIGMVYHDPATPSSLDELISRADSLMYEQKRNKAS